MDAFIIYFMMNSKGKNTMYILIFHLPVTILRFSSYFLSPSFQSFSKLASGILSDLKDFFLLKLIFASGWQVNRINVETLQWDNQQ